MKVSVITICKNSAATVEATIRSVAAQDYPDVEYILIDGASQDDTLKIIRSHQACISRMISEPDLGLYDALNKGIRHASGEVIALLHSDDVYHDDKVLSRIVRAFQESHADAVYTDLEYVASDDVGRTARYWRAGQYEHGAFLRGWMPPHPALFIRQQVYRRFGLYNTDFHISADYEFMLRIIHKYGISLHYLPGVSVKMRVGGKSNFSWRNRILANREDRRAWKINGLRPHWYTLLLKPLSKITQFRLRRLFHIRCI